MNETLHRAGGVASLGYSEMLEPFDPGLFDPDDLPMLIWLRGDESICDEFTMDAEQVMAELGIKRSRLTQIAGKELRVGRMRVGRYVRPVFRAKDVQAYKAWVRASASHLKSSRAIEDAAAKLEHETSLLADKVKDAASAELETLNERLLTLHQISQRHFVDFAAGVHHTLESSKQRAEQTDAARDLRERELLHTVTDFVLQVQSQNNVIHTALASLTGVVQSQRVELMDLGVQLQSLGSKAESLTAAVQEYQQQQEHFNASIEARILSQKDANSRLKRRAVAKERRATQRMRVKEAKIAVASLSSPSPGTISRQMRRATRR